MPKPAVRLLQRVAIALQAGQQDQDLLQLALTLAETSRAELTALLVEDENLVQLARLPFAREVLRLSASVQTLDDAYWTRLKRRHTEQIRQRLQQMTALSGLQTTFQTAQGAYLAEVMRAAQVNDAVFLAGRRFQSQALQRRFGMQKSTPKPVWVLLDATKQALYALQVGAELCRSMHYRLMPVLDAQAFSNVNVWPDSIAAIVQQYALTTAPLIIVPELSLAALLAALNRQEAGLLILSRNMLLARTELRLLEKIPCPILLVHTD